MTIHVQTPLIESDAFSTAGQRVWLRLQALQPSGSFKLRGVGHACETHAARGALRLLSSSGGHAGLVAFAWTKRHEVISTTVSDIAALQACFEKEREHRLVVEPACGAAMAGQPDGAGGETDLHGSSR